MGSYELVWIYVLFFFIISCMDCVGGVCRWWWREMVLEKYVVFVSDIIDVFENIVFYEVVDIRVKFVDNVVVILDIDLGNLVIGSSKGFSVVFE